MKKTILTILAVASFVSSAAAADSIAIGARYGGEIANNSSVRDSSEFYEAFGDLYINPLVSVGATLAYTAADHKTLTSIRKEETYPVTALFKVHLPIPYLNPYAGLGQSFIFHNRNKTTGSPIMFAGADISPVPGPLFLNIEYRHQFNGGDLDFIAGGVGVKF
jgi:hypothetical protein